MQKEILQKNKKEITNFNKGFTLVEIIVSLGIFAIVMVIAMGAFLKIVDMNKRAQSIKTAVNNLAFTMETMSRELRTGINYHCGTNLNLSQGAMNSLDQRDCINGGNELYFIAKTIDLGGSTCNVVYGYKIEQGKILKGETYTGGGSCTHFTWTGSGNIAGDVTSDSVVVDPGSSFITGLSDSGQPYVLIKMMGTVGTVERAKTTFNIQTLINQRI